MSHALASPVDLNCMGPFYWLGLGIAVGAGHGLKLSAIVAERRAGFQMPPNHLLEESPVLAKAGPEARTLDFGPFQLSHVHEFPEYDTSGDNLDFIRQEHLAVSIPRATVGCRPARGRWAGAAAAGGWHLKAIETA